MLPISSGSIPGSLQTTVIFVFNSLNKMNQVNHSEEMGAGVNRHICSAV